MPELAPRPEFFHETTLPKLTLHADADWLGVVASYAVVPIDTAFITELNERADGSRKNLRTITWVNECRAAGTWPEEPDDPTAGAAEFIKYSRIRFYNMLTGPDPDRPSPARTLRERWIVPLKVIALTRLMHRYAGSGQLAEVIEEASSLYLSAYELVAERVEMVAEAGIDPVPIFLSKPGIFIAKFVKEGDDVRLVDRARVEVEAYQRIQAARRAGALAVVPGETPPAAP